MFSKLDKTTVDVCCAVIPAALAVGLTIVLFFVQEALIAR